MNRQKLEELRQEREYLQAAYGSAYEGLLSLLAQHDPIRLVAVGAPEDEYKAEVGTILPRLIQATESGTFNEAVVLQVLAEEFSFWFSLEMVDRVQTWAEIAAVIASEWRDGIE